MLTGILYTCDDMNLSYSQSTMNKERKRFAADILGAKITDSLLPPTEEAMREAVELDVYSVHAAEEQNILKSLIVNILFLNNILCFIT